RRRHTRSYGDWSSDVCSSDLYHSGSRAMLLSPSGPGRSTGARRWNVVVMPASRKGVRVVRDRAAGLGGAGERGGQPRQVAQPLRSEERRVGKEGSARWGG